jgi:hypothetical protein
MKSNFSKIVMTALILIFSSGYAMADGWKDESGKRGHGYGHYKDKEVHHYQHYAPPRPIYVEHYHRPVIVERHYYHEPVRYVAPAPSGFFFGMSVADRGSAFSFGVSGR